MNTRQRFPSALYPFSDALCEFMDAHPEFLDALKLSAPHRFSFIEPIIISHTPKSHKRSRDQVIGMWYLDKQNNSCVFHGHVCAFKQDFIVNVEHKDKEFIAYSSARRAGACVRTIQEFFSVYGSGGRFYTHDRGEWQHHYWRIEDLPRPDLQASARHVTGGG